MAGAEILSEVSYQSYVMNVVAAPLQVGGRDSFTFLQLVAIKMVPSCSYAFASGEEKLPQFFIAISRNKNGAELQLRLCKWGGEASPIFYCN